MLSLEHLKDLAIKYEEEVGPAVHHFVTYVERKIEKLLHEEEHHRTHHNKPHEKMVAVPVSIQVDFRE